MLKDMINKYAVLIPTYNDNLENIEKTFSSIPFDANILVIDDGSKIPFESLTAQALCRYINLK
ncbi:glycosyl transferase family 2, partial [Escherichia coli]